MQPKWTKPLNYFFSGLVMVPLTPAENPSDVSKRFLGQKNCPSGCDRSFRPVCGGLLYFFERTTYANECTMKMAACEEHRRKKKKTPTSIY